MSAGRPSDDLTTGRPSKRLRSEPSSSTAAATQLKDLGMLVAAFLDANNNSTSTQPSPTAPEKLTHVLQGAGAFLQGSHQYHLTHRFIALRLFLSIVQLCTHDARLVQHCVDNLLGVLRDGPLCSLLLHLNVVEHQADSTDPNAAAVMKRSASSSVGSSSATATRVGSGRQGTDISSNKVVVERCLGACRTLGATIARHYSHAMPVAPLIQAFWKNPTHDGDDVSSHCSHDVEVLRVITGLALIEGVEDGSPRNIAFAPLLRDEGAPSSPLLLDRCIEECLWVVQDVTLTQSRILLTGTDTAGPAPPPLLTAVALDAMEVCWTTALRLVATIVRRRHVTGDDLAVVLCGGLTMSSWAMRLPGAVFQAISGALADCLDILVGALPNNVSPTSPLLQSIFSTVLASLVGPTNHGDQGAQHASAHIGLRISRQCQALLAHLESAANDVKDTGRDVFAMDVLQRLIYNDNDNCLRDSNDIVPSLVHQLTVKRGGGVGAVATFLRVVQAVPQFGAIIAQHRSQNSPWLATMCAVGQSKNVIGEPRTSRSCDMEFPTVATDAEALAFLLRGGLLDANYRRFPVDAQPANDNDRQQVSNQIKIFAASAVRAASIQATWTSLETNHLLLQAVLVCDDLTDVLCSGYGDQSRVVGALMNCVVGDDVAFALLRFAIGLVHSNPNPNITHGSKLHKLVVELAGHVCGINGTDSEEEAMLRQRVCSLLWLLEEKNTLVPRSSSPVESSSSKGAPSASTNVITAFCRGASSLVPQRCDDDVLIDALRWATSNRIARQLDSKEFSKGGFPQDELQMWLHAACGVATPPSPETSYSMSPPAAARSLLLDLVGVTVAVSLQRIDFSSLLAPFDAVASASRALMESFLLATSRHAVVARLSDHACFQLLEYALTVVVMCDGGDALTKRIGESSTGLRTPNNPRELAATYPFAIGLMRNILGNKRWNVDVLFHRRMMKLLFPILVVGTGDGAHSDESRLTYILQMLVPPTSESVGDLTAMLCRQHADQMVASAVMDSRSTTTTTTVVNGTGAVRDISSSTQATLVAAVLPKAAYLPAAIACCILESVDANRDPISVSSDVPSSPRGRGKVIEDLCRHVYRWELLALAKGCEHQFSNIIVNLLSLIATPLSEKYNQLHCSGDEPSPISEIDLREAEVRFSDAVYIVCGLGSLADRPDGGFTPAVIDRACAQQAKPADPTRGSNSAAMKTFKQRFLRSLFDVLHTILKRMHFEDDGGYRASPTGLPVCASTARRWLCALAILTRLLREDVVQLMQKLPAILHFAQRGGPSLVDMTAVVWANVIRVLPTSFVATNTATLLAELVALESQTGTLSTITMLQDAARSLFDATQDASPFWKSHCAAVLGRSEVVKVLTPMLPAISLVGPGGGAAAVLHGFVVAIGTSNNTSATCKYIFLRGLRDYLSSRALDELLTCADIVNSPSSVIPLQGILADCIRCNTASRMSRVQQPQEQEDDDATNVPYLAAHCFGLLGGGPIVQSTSTVTTASDGAAAASPNSDAQFSLLHMFEWRHMLHALLDVHLVRALASTSDSTMHDRAALATQSLLRSGVKHERIDARSLPLLESDRVYVEELDRYWWWSKLPSLTKTLLSPFTSTKYTPFVRSTRATSVPEFHSALSAEDWLFSWYCSLTERLAGTLIGEIALACRNTTKKDTSLRDYLMPHMLLRIVTQPPAKTSHDNEETISDVDSVVLEFKAVFGAAKTHPVHAQKAIMMLDSVEEMWTFTKLFLKKQAAIACSVDKDTLTQWGASLAALFTSHSEVMSHGVRSRAAAECGLFHRSIRALECQRYVAPVADSIVANPQLLRCYSSLGDDVVAAQLMNRVGCGSSLTPSSTSAALDDAASLEQTGQWELARRAAERYLQHHPTSTKHQLILVRCMRHLGETHLTTRYVRSILAEKMGAALPRTGAAASSLSSTADEQIAELHALGQEASWRMGEWGDEASMTTDVVPPPPRESLFKSIQSLIETSRDAHHLPHLVRTIHQQRQGVVARIVKRSSAGDITEQALLEDLCILADAESAAHHLCKVETIGENKENHNERLLSFFVGRADRADPTAELKATFLSVRRVLFGELGRADVVSRAWVEEAKTMRKRSKIDAALQAVQHAAAQGSTATCVKYYTEAAKLWHLKDPARGIEFAEAVVRNGTLLPAEVTGKMILYATKWQNELVPQPEDDVVSGYRRALQLHDGAKGHLFLAQFYDGLYEPMAAASAAAPASMKLHATAKLTHSAEALVTHAIRHYAKSLVHSAKVSSIALPRAMTLWLEHSALMFAEIGHIPPANRAKVDAGIQELNVLMESYFVAEAPGSHHQSHHNNQAKVSPILTMQALPQLISRLAHAHQGTTASIAKILLSLLSICPQQVLWGLLPVVRSIKQPRRATVAKQQVAQLFQRRGAEESRLVESVSTVFTAFLDICNASPDLFTDPRVRLSQMPFIRKVEKAIATSHCILPITPNISPNWSTLTTAPAGPTFSAFDDAVEVMSSLQKPKRMAVIGSDGVKYPFLCKAKDDPKKDIRMMEIVNRMNLLFQQDPESRKRRYRLRGYVVAALGDDYALIEWVSHQCALRRAVDDTYSVDGTGIRTATVRSLMAKIDGKTLTRMDMFKKHILVDAKPVFHQWFYHKFEDAAKWYQARQRYTVSCALWCAVGHIVGLGDRHGENMLIDTNTGEAMHVDFACMFDKGESLQEPERVRFRLTQNVVDALGVLGVDGGFRSTFETALRTQIQNKSEIMCVLETLLHDPLIEWGDRAKADPRQLFHRVRRRLEGYLDLNARSKEMDPVAQDASHQTSRLIEHATHWDNLSMMYIWWMAWV